MFFIHVLESKKEEPVATKLDVAEA